MLNISDTNRKLYNVQLNNQIKITKIQGFDVGTKSLKDISSTTLELFNNYLKSINLPSIQKDNEEINLGNVKQIIPLFKKTFEMVSLSFYYHPDIQKYFREWFYLQFDSDGIPKISSEFDQFYRNVFISNNKLEYQLYRTFISNVQIFDTITINSPDLLEINVTLVPNYIQVVNL